MATSQQRRVELKEACDILVEFSVDRSEIKQILDGLPNATEAELGVVEYETQILKILAVGWGITYFLEKDPNKTRLSESFWNSILEFATNISTITSTTSGKDINYFQEISQRVQTYVNVITQNQDAKDPAEVVGLTFAKMCKNDDDPYTIIAGKRVFNYSLSQVDSYLDSIELI